jgi:hypothetical protein
MPAVFADEAEAWAKYDEVIRAEWDSMMDPNDDGPYPATHEAQPSCYEESVKSRVSESSKTAFGLSAVEGRAAVGKRIELAQLVGVAQALLPFLARSDQ